MNAKILYVEDDLNLGFVTKDNLELHGYEICHCLDGAEALQRFGQQHFDLCVIDVMLPGLDGFALAQQIRARHHEVPIIFLTSKAQKEDRIRGLKLGADDYITKPFSIEELALRIEVFLRRSKISPAAPETTSLGVFVLGSYRLDYPNLNLMGPGSPQSLTQREADLLRLFCQNLGKVLRREEILLAIWGDDDYFNGRSLDVFISRLRKYLRDVPSINLENIHGVGFRLSLDGATD
jgi:two-component system, OmpR family, response regulator VicR